MKCLVAATEVDQAPYDHRMLAYAETQLSNVVRSRQQGLEFGELFSHIIFGAITVVLTLLSPPAVTGWIGFLLEMLVALFSAVIGLLVVNVGFTPEPVRRDFGLERNEEFNGDGMAFRDAVDRKLGQTDHVHRCGSTGDGGLCRVALAQPAAVRQGMFAV